ncbi:MAG: GNAT family N-acetyltransferase [Candidatus Krumholzibacteriota bacterium]|nr:GNAT family N-acetyltransferase [Candidatus Krumholzibacteriota bacterium]
MEPDKNRTWEKRPFKDSDREKLKALYENVQSRPFNPQHWSWQFREASAAEGYIWMADHQGTLAGQYATIPVRIQVRDKKIKGALSLDTMTRGDFRKQGIFVALARAVYQQLRSNGVRLVYGFPNDNSYPGFIKHLDFRVLEKLPALVRPLNISEIARVKTGNRLLSRWVGLPAQTLWDLIFTAGTGEEEIEIESPREFTPAVDQLFEELSPQFGNMLVRDYSYLRWRYDQNPKHDYHRFLAYRRGKLAGYCVCGRTERRGISIGLIVDLFASPRDRELAAALIDRALRGFREQKLALASCLLIPGSPFMKVLKRWGFIFTARRFPFILRNNTGDLAEDDVFSTRHWHITYGDGDFV